MKNSNPMNHVDNYPSILIYNPNERHDYNIMKSLFHFQDKLRKFHLFFWKFEKMETDNSELFVKREEYEV